MNIFEYAMEFEKDSENYYRDLLKITQDQGLKKILSMLAEEEVKHYNHLKKLAENADTELPDTQILINSVNIFTEIRKSKKYDLKGTQVDLYRKAKEFELKSKNYYLAKKEETNDQKLKAILQNLANQEDRHYILLDNIIQFVTRPEQWLEDAEFNQMTNY